MKRFFLHVLTACLFFLSIQSSGEEIQKDLGENVKKLRSDLKSMGYIIGKERLYAGIEKGGRIIFTARMKTSTFPDFIAFGATHDGTIKEFLFTVYEADNEDKIIRKLVSKKATGEILIELKGEKIENYHIEIELLDNSKDLSVVEILYGFIHSFTKDKQPSKNNGTREEPYKNRPLSDFEKSGYFQWGKIRF